MQQIVILAKVSSLLMLLISYHKILDKISANYNVSDYGLSDSIIYVYIFCLCTYICLEGKYCSKQSLAN